MDQTCAFHVTPNIIELINQAINHANVMLEDTIMEFQPVKYVVPFVKHVLEVLQLVPAVKHHRIEN